LLAEETTDLTLVNATSLGTGLHHEREVVAQERRLQTRGQAGLDDVRGGLVDDGLHLSIELHLGVLFVLAHPLGDLALEGLQLRGGHVATHWCSTSGAARRADRADETSQLTLRVRLDLQQQALSLDVCRLRQSEIGDTTRMSRILKMKGHHTTEGTQQAARELSTV